MRQAYRQRVLPAHWATKFKATFNHAAKAAPLGSPFDVDRGPTVVVTDTGNNLSTNGTALVCAGGAAAGDPGLWGPAMQRVQGRGVFFRVNITDATQIAEFGWDSNQAGALGATGFRCAADIMYATVGGVVNPALFVPADATAYDLLVVTLSTGALLLRKLPTENSWTLLWRSATGTTTPVYAAVSNNNAAFTLTGSARPFTVVDLGWTDTSFRRVNVAAPAAITPTEAASLWDADASTFEGAGTYAWVAAGGNTIANVGNTLQITYVNDVVGATCALSDAADLSSNLTVGAWYRLVADCATNAGSSWNPYISGPETTGAAVTGIALESRILAFRATHATANALRLALFGAGEVAIIDNLALYPITLASCLGTAYTVGNDGYFEVAPTLTTRTQAGLWICLDDETNPQNGYVIYQDGFTLKVDQVKAGVWTSLQSTVVTYGAGRRLCVWKSGTAIRAYYHDSLIGVQLTGDAALTGTKMACFSTLATNSFANLIYYPLSYTLPAWA